MVKLIDLNTQAVISINRTICTASSEPVGLLNGAGPIDSALHSAFYPGDVPYVHGGVARIAGAMAFYLAKAHGFQNGNKRTATAAALVFMQFNGFTLAYPGKALSDVIVAATENKLTMDDLKDWFDVHKQAFP